MSTELVEVSGYLDKYSMVCATYTAFMRREQGMSHEHM